VFRRAFLVPAAERALKSAAQAVLGLILGDLGFDVWQADWKKALGVAAGAAVLSLLTSIISYQAGPTGSPSLVADPEAANGVDPIVRMADRDARHRDPLH
jgi:hypothetical protein